METGISLQGLLHYTDLAPSVFLAKVLGLFCVIITLARLTRPKEYEETMTELAKTPALIYLIGFAVFMSGVLVVVSHSVWVADWQVIITIMGWSALFGGITAMLLPEMMSRVMTTMSKLKNRLVIDIVVLLVGFYLLRRGFFAG